MGKYKQFKTFIRKKLGLIGVAEFVDDAIAANTQSNWNKWFNDKKYLAEYVTPERINSYIEIIRICESNGVDFRSGKVIDIGCGTGHLLAELKKMHPNIEVNGTDFSQESINVSKNVNKEGDFFKMDIFDIPDTQYQQYDFVFCCEVLEHLLYPQRALENILSLVAKSGTIILTVPNGRIDTYGGHINFWSPESWGVFVDNCVGLVKGVSVSYKVFNNNRNLIAIIKTL